MTPTAIASYSGSDRKRADAPALSSADAPLSGELWAVVLAGGEGIRLRPLTRVICGDERPKQYVTLTGSRSLLQQTLDRAALADPGPNARSSSASRATRLTWRRRCPAIARPSCSSRRTAERRRACSCRRTGSVSRAPDATVAVFPSDHLVLEEERVHGPGRRRRPPSWTRTRRASSSWGRRPRRRRRSTGGSSRGPCSAAPAALPSARSVGSSRSRPRRTARACLAAGAVVEHLRVRGEGEHARRGRPAMRSPDPLRPRADGARRRTRSALRGAFGGRARPFPRATSRGTSCRT